MPLKNFSLKSPFIFVFISIISFHALANPVTPKPRPEQPLTCQRWRMLEITFTSAKTYSHPFEEVELEASFTGPNGVTIVRPGFWNGGNTWKIRFAPTITGKWTMISTCSDKSNKKLNQVSETIQSIPYEGNLDIFKHGFLKISENRRYFEYADGTPFFYLGDTHWIYIHERFNSSNKPGIASEFKYIVDKRVQQGFTVYQTEAIQHPHEQNSVLGSGHHKGADEEPFCNFRDGVDDKDMPGFENIDRKFQYIADKGLVNANSTIVWALDPSEFPAVYTEAYMSRLGRYWSARFGAYPVICINIMIQLQSTNGLLQLRR